MVEAGAEEGGRIAVRKKAKKQKDLVGDLVLILPRAREHNRSNLQVLFSSPSRVSFAHFRNTTPPSYQLLSGQASTETT